MILLMMLLQIMSLNCKVKSVIEERSSLNRMVLKFQTSALCKIRMSQMISEWPAWHG